MRDWESRLSSSSYTNYNPSETTIENNELMDYKLVTLNNSYFTKIISFLLP